MWGGGGGLLGLPGPCSLRAMSSSSRPWLLCTALLLGLALPFVGKPVHIDDANFLALARGARLDLWRPHAVPINWQGTTERAFDVLSNPPGIGWWLAPVATAPEWVQHLWMLPWLVLLALGAWRLGRRFGGDGAAGVLLLGTAPIAVLAAQSLTPDLPLLALTVAGLGGFIAAVDAGRQRAAAGWAVVAGSAVLFRYSGVTLLPLLLLYPLLMGRKPWGALAGFVPLVLLSLHDLHAYGTLHVVAMTGFQSSAWSGWELIRKQVAALAMLGAAGVLPFIVPVGRWRRLGVAVLVAALIGMFCGRGAVYMAGMPLGAAVWTGLCAGAGALMLLGPVLIAEDSPREARPERLFLTAWALGGFLFLLALRFTAARYWLPFLPAVALAWLRLRPSRTQLIFAVGLQVLLALGLSVDDLAMARIGRDAAYAVDAGADAHATQCEDGSGERVFAGHWGWQHYLEGSGWRSLEDEERLLPGTLLAVAETPWPQEPAADICLEKLWEQRYPDAWPGPRVHTAAGFANLHASLVAGQPPVVTFVPWTLASDPYEWVVLYRVCD